MTEPAIATLFPFSVCTEVSGSFSLVCCNPSMFLSFAGVDSILCPALVSKNSWRMDFNDCSVRVGILVLVVRCRSATKNFINIHRPKKCDTKAEMINSNSRSEFSFTFFGLVEKLVFWMKLRDLRKLSSIWFCCFINACVNAVALEFRWNLL